MFLTERYKSDDDELDFRDHKLIPWMRNNGKGDYADILCKYQLNLTDDARETGGVASIDAEDKVINLDTNYLSGAHSKDGNPPSENQVATIMKHELLHALLRHLVKSQKAIARNLGYDIYDLTPDQIDEINSLRGKINYIFKGWSAPVTWNSAADLDLARLYTDDEIEALADLGGLIRQDYPEYDNLTYEQVAKKMDEQSKWLEWNLTKKRYGRKISDTEFQVEREEESDYVGTCQLYARDITSIILPNYRMDGFMYYFIKKGSGWDNYDIWLSDRNKDDDEEVLFLPGASWRRMHRGTTKPIEPYFTAVWNAHAFIPVLKISSLRWYDKNIDRFELFGKYWLRAKEYSNYVFCTTACGYTEFNDMGHDNIYKGSKIEKYANNWLNSQIREYGTGDKYK